MVIKFLSFLFTRLFMFFATLCKFVKKTFGFLISNCMRHNTSISDIEEQLGCSLTIINIALISV